MEPPRDFCELLECFNANHVIEALTAFGFGDVGLPVTDFQQPDVVVQLGVPPIRIDLLTGIAGVTWQDAWAGRVSCEFGGVPVAFIGLTELRRNNTPLPLVPPADTIQKDRNT